MWMPTFIMCLPDCHIRTLNLRAGRLPAIIPTTYNTFGDSFGFRRYIRRKSIRLRLDCGFKCCRNLCRRHSDFSQRTIGARATGVLYAVQVLLTAFLAHIALNEALTATEAFEITFCFFQPVHHHFGTRGATGCRRSASLSISWSSDSHAHLSALQAISARTGLTIIDLGTHVRSFQAVASWRSTGRSSIGRFTRAEIADSPMAMTQTTW